MEDRSGDTFSTACVMALARLASYICPWLLPSSMLGPGPRTFSARDEAWVKIAEFLPGCCELC